MIVLRILHIGAGVLWVGSAFFFVAFLGPAAGQVGPDVSGPLFQVLVGKMRVPKVITGFATVAVIAGWLMWLKDLNDYKWHLNNWIFHSGNFGLVLTRRDPGDDRLLRGLPRGREERRADHRARWADRRERWPAVA
jgi:hypothetical protein